MSKLFDILSSGKGEIADLVRPLANLETEAAPQEPAAAPAAEVSVRSEASLAVPVAPAASAKMRTVGLRVPAPSPLLPFDDDGQPRPSEQYRILRTRIVQHPEQPRVLVVSSPAAGDGKSVTAINTAAALSLKSEANVLLMDADFRRSAIHVQLGLPQSPGLAEILRGACRPEDAIIQAREFPKLSILPAGDVQENPVELLDSAAWRSLCSRLREQFRYIVMDSPPVGAVADYDLIETVCDAVILVVRPDHTNRALLKKALDTIPKAKFMGVLLNSVPEWFMSKHASSDYYYYGGPKTYRKHTEQI